MSYRSANLNLIFFVLSCCICCQKNIGNEALSKQRAEFSKKKQHSITLRFRALSAKGIALELGFEKPAVRVELGEEIVTKFSIRNLAREGASLSLLCHLRLDPPSATPLFIDYIEMGCQDGFLLEPGQSKTDAVKIRTRVPLDLAHASFDNDIVYIVVSFEKPATSH